MKHLFTTAFLLLNLVLASSPSAHAQGPLAGPPAAPRPTVRPLTRYLAATLHLSPQQAAAVQQALRNQLARPLAPEALLVSLGPVLSLDAQQRLQSLQGDVATYRTLYDLAARH